MNVYHFTDTGRLPWILRSGELRPGSNRIGGFPDPDFIWATANPWGDRTASAHMGEYYRAGKLRLVRFTLDAETFFPWAEAPARYPQWTPRFVDALHVAAHRKSDPRDWWCRAEALPLTSGVEIHTRSYQDNRWLPLDPNTEVVPMTEFGQDVWLAIHIAGTIFASRKSLGPQGQDAFEVRAARDNPHGGERAYG